MEKGIENRHHDLESSRLGTDLSCCGDQPSWLGFECHDLDHDLRFDCPNIGLNVGPICLDF